MTLAALAEMQNRPPGFHHGAASLRSIIAPVGSLGGALAGVSEGKFGKLTV
jgi:hypothetical protein